MNADALLTGRSARAPDAAKRRTRVPRYYFNIQDGPTIYDDECMELYARRKRRSRSIQRRYAERHEWAHGTQAVDHRVED
jgi:hypothetical protein